MPEAPVLHLPGPLSSSCEPGLLFPIGINKREKGLRLASCTPAERGLQVAFLDTDQDPRKKHLPLIFNMCPENSVISLRSRAMGMFYSAHATPP